MYNVANESEISLDLFQNRRVFMGMECLLHIPCRKVEVTICIEDGFLCILKFLMMDNVLPIECRVDTFVFG